MPYELTNTLATIKNIINTIFREYLEVFTLDMSSNIACRCLTLDLVN